MVGAIIGAGLKKLFGGGGGGGPSKKEKLRVLVSIAQTYGRGSSEYAFVQAQYARTAARYATILSKYPMSVGAVMPAAFRHDVISSTIPLAAVAGSVIKFPGVKVTPKKKARLKRALKAFLPKGPALGGKFGPLALRIGVGSTWLGGLASWVVMPLIGAALEKFRTSDIGFSERALAATSREPVKAGIPRSTRPSGPLPMPKSATAPPGPPPPWLLPKPKAAVIAPGAKPAGKAARPGVGTKPTARPYVPAPLPQWFTITQQAIQTLGFPKSKSSGPQFFFGDPPAPVSARELREGDIPFLTGVGLPRVGSPEPQASPQAERAKCKCKLPGKDKTPGECRRGYFTEQPDGEVEYTAWEYGKCRRSKKRQQSPQAA